MVKSLDLHLQVEKHRSKPVAQSSSRAIWLIRSVGWIGGRGLEICKHHCADQQVGSLLGFPCTTACSHLLRRRRLRSSRPPLPAGGVQHTLKFPLYLPPALFCDQTSRPRQLNFEPQELQPLQHHGSSQECYEAQSNHHRSRLWHYAFRSVI